MLGVLLTGGWVILQPEVDVFLDTKAKAARVGEVLAPELVLLHLEPSLKDLQRLVAADLRPPDEHINQQQMGLKSREISTRVLDSAGGSV